MPGDGPIWTGGARLLANDRALQYGDGVFETIAIDYGRAWLLDRHLLRLASGVQRLGLNWPSEINLRKVFRDAAAASRKLETGVLKLTISSGGEQRGYARDPTAAGLVRAALYGSRRAAHTAPLRLYLCKTRLASQPRLAGLKHLNRLEQVLASSEWQAGEFDEGLMLDQEGNIVEATASNLLFAQNGRLFTPALESCGVHGVLRAALLESDALGIAEAELASESLAQVEGLWLCNSVQGIRAVGRVQNSAVEHELPQNVLASSLAKIEAHLRASERFELADQRLVNRLQSLQAPAPLLQALAGCVR